MSNMKKNKYLIPIISIVCALVFVAFVKAQTIGNVTVSPRCNSNGQIDIDYAYKIYSTEGHTNYIAMITAGRCERQFRGTINRITNVQTSIELDIRNQITNRALALYPDPFGDLDVDGRGNFVLT